MEDHYHERTVMITQLKNPRRSTTIGLASATENYSRDLANAINRIVSPLCKLLISK